MSNKIETLKDYFEVTSTKGVTSKEIIETLKEEGNIEKHIKTISSGKKVLVINESAKLWDYAKELYEQGDKTNGNKK